MARDERSHTVEFDPPLKRTLHIPDLLPEPDAEKLLFPGGVVCGVGPRSGAELASRVELLTQEHSYERVGLMRQLFVGYTSHPVVLDVAQRTNYVVEVRTVDWIKRHSAESYLKDLLVVKRAPEEASPEVGSKVVAPTIWLEKVGLSSGGKVILSNPFNDFLIPSPERTSVN